MRFLLQGKFRILLVAGVVIAAAAALYAGSVWMESRMPPGPPVEAGRILFQWKKCIRCHKVEGTGGMVGPDLTIVALRRRPSWMDDYLRDPKAVNPEGKMPRPKLTGDQRAALVAYLKTLDAAER
jgi:cytochrome c2